MSSRVAQVDPDSTSREVVEHEAIDFIVSHDMMLGACNVKATGKLKTPQSDPFFESDTFNLRGRLRVVHAKRTIGYEVPVKNRDALRAVKETRATVRMTFESPGGCNGGLDEPEPVSVKFTV